jgi:hypothetical protein
MDDLPPETLRMPEPGTDEDETRRLPLSEREPR